MIKLFKVKERQRELAENANGKLPIKKQSAGELRLHKDISELNLHKTCTLAFSNGKDDLMNFEVTIRPDEGYYLGGTFVFSFQISSIYPHEAPKVKCKTKLQVTTNVMLEIWGTSLQAQMLHVFHAADVAEVSIKELQVLTNNYRKRLDGSLSWFEFLSTFMILITPFLWMNLKVFQ
ncbi:NEDD8-conjugating enzyme Ubc [Salix suchowensis]|nr:NEDD8-conjugating enzyme Ubc [Salix suchowensis]